MATIKKIALGKNGPLVSKLGLGCMRMSPVWGGPSNDETESVATIRMALDSGINFVNTGDFYGSGHNELLAGKTNELLERYNEHLYRKNQIAKFKRDSAIFEGQVIKADKTGRLIVKTLYEEAYEFGSIEWIIE